MAEEPDAERLKALEKRIAAARASGKVRKGPRNGVGFTAGEVAWRMVIELCSGMVLGLALGYGLDVLFGTMPVFLVIFALLGFAAGVRVMMGTAREMEKMRAGQAPNDTDEAGKPREDERD